MLENLFRRVTHLSQGVSSHPQGVLPPRYFPSPEELVATDGDNVTWRGRNCRLKGYDAPELHPRRQGKFDVERERGRQARDRLAALIASAKRLEITHHGEIDRFNRPLLYLYVDGVDVAQIAIHEGWGVAYEKGKKPRWWDDQMRFNVPK